MHPARSASCSGRYTSRDAEALLARLAKEGRADPGRSNSSTPRALRDECTRYGVPFWFKQVRRAHPEKPAVTNWIGRRWKQRPTPRQGALV